MLRHQPEEFDLELDEYGYAEVEDVVRALNERLGESVDEEDLRDAVLGGDRQRYEIEGSRIRALYGHSIEVQPGEPAQPPAELYVGVSSGDADRARRHGLRAGRRRFLHLALTPEDAMESGRRAAHEYVVITVRAGDAWEEGINFYDRRSLFLSDPIPTEFLEVGELHTDGFGEENVHRGRGDRGGRREERGHGGPRHGDRHGRSHAAQRVETHVHEDTHEGGHGDEAEVAYEESESEAPAFGESAAPAAERGEGSGRRRRRGRGRGRAQDGAPSGGGSSRHELRPHEPRATHGHGGGSRAPRHEGRTHDAPRETRAPDDRPRYEDRPPRREHAPREDRPRHDDRPPRRDDAPRYDDRAPRRDDAPRHDDRPPRRDEPSRFDDRPRREEPARGGHGGGRSEHRPQRGFGDSERRPDRGERRPSAPRRDEHDAPAARRHEADAFGGGMSEAPEAPRRDEPSRSEERPRRAPEPRPAPQPKRERKPESDDGGFGAGI
jgi:putative RNA 2'-phosphotransferase